MITQCPSLGAYIRKYRLQAGLTQAELGKALGYSSQFIANWERSASGPPANVLRKLVQTLGMPEREFLDLLLNDSLRYWKTMLQGRRKTASKVG